jgi:hypothetical protein
MLNFEYRMLKGKAARQEANGIKAQRQQGNEVKG